MRHCTDRSQVLIACLAGLASGACFPEAATLEGRACDPAGRCAAGFVCEPVSNRCVSVDGGSAEICDGLDNDLDGLTDEGLPEATLFQDSDRDGFGARAAPPTLTCAGRPGWAATAGDCDDQDPARAPGAVDTVGDGVDQNCDGLDGVDVDGDGHASKASGGDDCLDTERTCIADCSTDFDGDGPDCADFCVDVDGDGYGVPGGAIGAACLGPDCDDRIAACFGAVCPDLDADTVLDCVDTCWGAYDPSNADTDNSCPLAPYTQDPRCGDACS